MFIVQYFTASYIQYVYRARICKRLRSPGINTEESVPPAYVAWRAGTPNAIIEPARQGENRFLGSLKSLQLWAQYSDFFKSEVT
jgi:hypothetical protein